MLKREILYLVLVLLIIEGFPALTSTMATFVTAVVYVADCETREAIPDAAVTIFQPNVILSTGFTNTTGEFYTTFVLWVPWDQAEHIFMRVIKAKAEKPGFGPSREIDRDSFVYLQTPLGNAVHMNIWLCLPKLNQRSAALNATAIPSTVTIRTGGYQQIIWRFKETNNGVGVTLTSRTAVFKGPTGQVLSGTVGPYSNSIRVSGWSTADWSDNIYLPPDVADKAKFSGWSSVSLEETFYGHDDNGNPVEATAILTINIEFPPANQAPQAYFTYQPASPKAGESVQFDGSSSYDPDGQILTWSWDFGDGHTDKGRFVTHSYSSPGTYIVTLVVADNEGATDRVSQAIGIQSSGMVACPQEIRDISIPGYDRATIPPKCSCVYRIKNVPKGTCIAADLTGIERRGSYGGYTMSLREGAPPTKSVKDATSWGSSCDPYTAHKEYIRYATSSPTSSDVYIKVDNAGDTLWTYTLELSCCGCLLDLPSQIQDAVEDERIYVVRSPPAHSTVIIEVFGPEGKNIDLYARKGKSPSYIKYDWRGTSPGSKERVECWIGDSSDDIYIMITRVGCPKESVEFSLRVRLKESLQAFFTYAPTNPQAGEPITFDASDSKGEIRNYQWSFGDGTFAEGKVVTHIYPAGGRYTVNLLVTDIQGATAQASQEIEVQLARPRACFSVDPLVPKAGETVKFDASCSEPRDRIAMYRWAFGDGGISYGQMVSHAYQASGIYPVILVVTDDNGNSEFSMQIIEVQCGDLRPAFVHYPKPSERIIIHQPVSFDASPSEPSADIVNYKWDFGDGGSADGQIVAHVYQKPGVYTITLTISDKCSNSASTSKQIEVLKPAISELIAKEMLSADVVTVDGQQYLIVELAHYIDPETLELVERTGVKVYTDTDLNPIGNEEVALKVGIIDTAREHAARRSEYLDDFITMLSERWCTHQWLKILNFFKERLAGLVAKAVYTYIVEDVLIPEDLILYAADVVKTILTHPVSVFESLIYNDFLTAKEEYEAVLELAESETIADLETAVAFLTHLYRGLANHLPAQDLLDHLDQIESSLPDFIREIAKKLLDELTKGVSGRFNDFIDEFKRTQEIGAYIQARRELLMNLERILTVRNWEADYSLALASVDP